jgi:hypothetical protein
MTQPSLPLFLYIFFPCFIAFWLAITAMLGILSGWAKLQRNFPATMDTSLLTLRMRSGRMGRVGVHMGNILTLSAGSLGLRVGIFRLFGPFSRPFLVPWQQIRADQRTSFFVPSVRLSFGRPEIGTLTIDAQLWRRLAVHSSVPGMAAQIPAVSLRRSGLGLLVSWVAITALVATVLYLSSHAQGHSGLPIAACIGLPGIFFAIVMAERLLRQIR